MLVLQGSGEEVAALRGSLRHSWLENLVEAREPTDVAELHGEETAVRRLFDEDIGSGGGFNRRLDEVELLAGRIVDGLSPARVVWRGPLAHLPEELKEELGAVLHELYLEQSSIQDVAEGVVRAAEAFRAELERFRNIWERNPKARFEEVAAGFESLKVQGRILYGALGLIPEGLVLP